MPNGGDHSRSGVSEILPACEDCVLKPVALCGAFLQAAPTDYYGLKRTFRSVPARRVIVKAGSAADSLMTLKEGWAFSYQFLSDGRRHIHAFYIPGDSIGLDVDPGVPLAYAVQALTPVQICTFDNNSFIARGQKHAEFSRDVRVRDLAYVRSLEERLIYVSRYPAASRIAWLILSLRQRLDQNARLKGDTMDFPLTQTHVADALGLTAAHVNRMFSDMRSERVVSLERAQLTILDLDRLTEITREMGT